jgi:hypothetical protein
MSYNLFHPEERTYWAREPLNNSTSANRESKAFPATDCRKGQYTFVLMSKTRTSPMIAPVKRTRKNALVPDASFDGKRAANTWYGA